ncbi:hypothetical protein AAJV73_14100 [Cyanobium sp. BSA11S]|uniref:hypothetical protein n=1 Tax=Synechococcales TaxID=1890424 RepID=UPI001627D3B0|nr:hypothetical protein [Synechococcus sp. BSF8S]
MSSVQQASSSIGSHRVARLMRRAQLRASSTTPGQILSGSGRGSQAQGGQGLREIS